LYGKGVSPPTAPPLLPRNDAAVATIATVVATAAPPMAALVVAESAPSPNIPVEPLRIPWIAATSFTTFCDAMIPIAFAVGA